MSAHYSLVMRAYNEPNPKGTFTMPLPITTYTPVQVVINDKAFTYKLHPLTCDALDLKPRDTVVVPFGAKGLVVGVVESVGQIPLDPTAKFLYKWIAAVVDVTTYNAILNAVAVPTVAPDEL